MKLLEYSPLSRAWIVFTEGKVLSPRKIVRSQIMQPGQAQMLIVVCVLYIRSLLIVSCLEGLIGTWSRLSEVEGLW